MKKDFTSEFLVLIYRTVARFFGAPIARLSFIARIAVAWRRTHTGERRAYCVFDKYFIRGTEGLPQEVGQENAM